MAIYLDEDMFGKDDMCIGFPHVLLCMALVLQTRNYMYGVHLGFPKRNDFTVDKFAEYLISQGVIGSDMIALYGCCNHSVRYSNDWSWKEEMREIAGKLAFRGSARGFDTGIIAPEHGTYLEYQREALADHLRIFYKRNEKMTFTGTEAANPQVFKVSRSSGTVRIAGSAQTGATVIRTESNKGMLHEVNYALRLGTFTV